MAVGGRPAPFPWRKRMRHIVGNRWRRPTLHAMGPEAGRLGSGCAHISWGRLVRNGHGKGEGDLPCVDHQRPPGKGRGFLFRLIAKDKRGVENRSASGWTALLAGRPMARSLWLFRRTHHGYPCVAPAVQKPQRPVGSDHYHYPGSGTGQRPALR